jgi:hypothetical protein
MPKNSSAFRSASARSPAADRNSTAARPPALRSAVTNGSRVLLDGDGNSAWTRRYRDLVAGHVADLGGLDLLSEAQIALIRDAAAMEIELEEMRGRMSRGEEPNLDLYGRIAGHRRRILETLGVKRQPRPVQFQSLDEIKAEYEAKNAARAAAIEQEGNT